jgi:hypothetical protein
MLRKADENTSRQKCGSCNVRSQKSLWRLGALAPAAVQRYNTVHRHKHMLIINGARVEFNLWCVGLYTLSLLVRTNIQTAEILLVLVELCYAQNFCLSLGSDRWVAATPHSSHSLRTVMRIARPRTMGTSVKSSREERGSRLRVTCSRQSRTD